MKLREQGLADQTAVGTNSINNKGEPSATKRHVGPSTIIGMEVHRDPVTILMRVGLPALFMTIMSWSGFFISPTALMPRFASSFISFLALQSFAKRASDSMAKNIHLKTWVDFQLTTMGTLMALAVIENVVVQYVHNRFSERTARHIDYLSMICFPLCFSVYELSMFILVWEFNDRSIDDAGVMGHWMVGLNLFAWIPLVVIVVFGVYMKFRFARQTFHWWVRDQKQVGNTVGLTISPTELHHVYMAIDTDGGGSLDTTEFVNFILALDFGPGDIINKSIVAHVRTNFSDSTIFFRDFKAKMTTVIKQAVDMESAGSLPRFAPFRSHASKHGGAKFQMLIGDPDDGETEFAFATNLACVTEGCRVRHETRGLGRVERINASSLRGRPYRVRFDSGEVHEYSEGSMFQPNILCNSGVPAPSDSQMPSFWNDSQMPSPPVLPSNGPKRPVRHDDMLLMGDDLSTTPVLNHFSAEVSRLIAALEDTKTTSSAGGTKHLRSPAIRTHEAVQRCLSACMHMVTLLAREPVYCMIISHTVVQFDAHIYAHEHAGQDSGNNDNGDDPGTPVRAARSQDRELEVITSRGIELATLKLMRPALIERSAQCGGRLAG